MSRSPDTRIGAEGVTRRFGPIVANDGVDLSVAPGTIHAVVGENGAGKSTLMRILYGLDQPDRGTVVVDDEAVTLAGPQEGIARGIGMVQQELAVVPDLTLLENLVLGAEPGRGGVIDWGRARTRAGELESQTGVELDWDRRAAAAPISSLQRLEILRLLYRGVDTLILDEPTAVLAPAQVTELFRLLNELRDRGRTVLFISHKLNEVLEISERVTVMRGGRVIRTVPADDTTAEQLADALVGESVETVDYHGAGEAGGPVLSVEQLATVDDRRIRRLDGVSFEVRAGEIVGVAGVAGNGQDELVECLVGLRRATSGAVRLGGHDITGDGVAGRRGRGLAYISADRAHEGLAAEASLRDNALAGFHRAPGLSRSGWLRPGRVTDFVNRLLDDYGVQRGGLDQPVWHLSGGNQQRLVVGRELEQEPELLVASHPTRGVDVKGIAFVHEQLLELRDRGVAVLLVSEELDELLRLADRVLVLLDGRVNGEVAGDPDHRRELGRLMLTPTERAQPA